MFGLAFRIQAYKKDKLENKYLMDLHSVNSLSWRLTLGSSKLLLIVLMNKSICERTICHGMLIHTILLKV